MRIHVIFSCTGTASVSQIWRVNLLPNKIYNIIKKWVCQLKTLPCVTNVHANTTPKHSSKDIYGTRTLSPWGPAENAVPPRPAEICASLTGHAALLKRPSSKDILLAIKGAGHGKKSWINTKTSTAGKNSWYLSVQRIAEGRLRVTAGLSITFEAALRGHLAGY